jgi:hypothetical protein
MSTLSIFNNHFVEFIDDIQSVFPDDVDIRSAKNSLLTIKKANPKMIANIWKTFVVNKYKKEIEEGKIEFFINKDYSTDFSISQYSDKITQAIDRLREPIKQMNEADQQKSMQYIQNLTNLSDMID